MSILRGVNFMDELLEIRNLYQDGKINLEEAICLASEQSDLSTDALKMFFLHVKRNNVIHHNFSKVS